MIRREKCVFCKQKTWMPTLHFVVHILEAIFPTEKSLSGLHAETLFPGQSSPFLGVVQTEQQTQDKSSAVSMDGRSESRKLRLKQRRRSSEKRSSEQETLSMISRRSDVLRWILECEHTIVCGCRHHIGEKIYCTKCGAYQFVRGWKHFDAGRASESSEGCRS